MRRGGYPYQGSLTAAQLGDPGPASSTSSPHRQHHQQHHRASPSLHAPLPTSSRTPTQLTSNRPLLPPAITSDSQSSIVRIPFADKNTESLVQHKTWTYQLSPGDPNILESAQAHLFALRRLSLAQGRLYAWKTRRKGVDKSSYNVQHDGIFANNHSTLYSVTTLSESEARARLDRPKDTAFAIGKRKEPEQSPELEGNDRPGGEAHRSTPGKEGTSWLTLHTFKVIPANQGSTIEETANVTQNVVKGSTPLDVVERKESPEDDLWGDGGETSPKGDEDAQRGAALAEEVTACQQSLSELIDRNEREALPRLESVTFSLRELYNSSEENNSGNSTESPALTSVRDGDRLLRSAMVARIAEHCVLSRALDIEEHLRQKEQIEESCGEETNRRSPTDTSDQKMASSSTTEEDGEIPDPVDEESDVQPRQGDVVSPSRPLRRLLKMGKGFLLFPRTVHQPHNFERERVVYVRIEASYSSHSAEDVVAQLVPEQLPYEYGLPQVGSRVLLAPWGIEGEAIETEDAELSLSSGSSDAARALTSLKFQVSERIELETGVEKTRLLEDRWIGVRESVADEDRSSAHRIPREVLWPQSLCFKLLPRQPSDASMKLVEQPFQEDARTRMKICHTPVSDLLKATVKMLDEDSSLTAQDTTSPAQKTEEEGSSMIQVSASTLEERSDIGDLSKPQLDVDVDMGDDTTTFASTRVDGDIGVEDPTDPDAGVDGEDDQDDNLFGSDEEVSRQPATPATILPNLTEENSSEDALENLNPQYPRFNDHDGLYGMDLVTEDDFAFFDDNDDEDILPLADADADADASMREIQQASTESSDDLAGAHAVVLQPRPSVAFVEGNGIASDPSSMPGFTPSSLTDSSPATGHPMDRTPRTPTSPYYDAGSMVGGHPGRVSANVYGDGLPQESWQAHDIVNISAHDASPSFEVMVTQDEKVAEEKSLAVPLPSHKRLRDVGEKYSSGKFAVSPGLAAAIAGGRRARDGHQRAGSATVVERTQDLAAEGKGQLPDQISSGLPALRKLRLLSRMEDDASEPGTVDSNLSEDEEDESDDDSLELDDEEREEEEKRQRSLQRSTDLLMSSLTTVNEWFLRSPVCPWTASENLGGQTSPAQEENSVMIKLRDEWIASLLSNPHLLEYAAPQGPRSRTLPALKAVDCQDLLDVCTRLSDSVLASPSFGQVEYMMPPRILVGCQGSLTEFDHTALRFWDKIGLCGAGGSRNVTAVLVHFSINSQGWREEYRLWFERLRHTFHLLGLGKFEVLDNVMLGSEEDDAEAVQDLTSKLFTKTELREETLRSLFSRFKDRLGPDQHVVVYGLGDYIPVHLLAAVKSLENDLRAIGKQDIGPFANHVHVRITPWSSIAGRGQSPSSRKTGSSIQKHALVLYDSLRVGIDHQVVRSLHPTVPLPSPVMMRLPSFLLVPPADSCRLAVSFTLDSKAGSAFTTLSSTTEATGKITFLHAAYDLGRNVGDLACICMMDESGQDGMLKVRRRTSDLRDTLLWIWSVISKYTDRACLRWRVVLSKSSSMSAYEVTLWNLLAESGIFRRTRCIDLTLASRDLRTPLLIKTSSDSQVSTVNQIRGTRPLPSEGLLIDASQSSYALYPDYRIWPSPAFAEGIVPASKLTGNFVDRRQRLALPLRSSATVTTRRSSLDCQTPSSSPLDSLIGQPETSGEGTHTAWLHILKVFPGRLFHLPSPAVLEQDDYLSDLIRQVTRSQFGLRLLAQEPYPLDSRGLTPWTFAALERIQPALETFKYENIDADKTSHTSPPFRRMNTHSTMTTTTGMSHEEEMVT